MLRRRSVLLAALAGVSARSGAARSDEPPAVSAGGGAVTRAHGLSMLGTPALPPDFAHFPYANPDAPKGGEVALSAVGTFDSFNPYIIRGNAPNEIGRIYDALLIASADEAATTYGHLAEVIELPDNRMWVAFELRPQARFHDGSRSRRRTWPGPSTRFARKADPSTGRSSDVESVEVESPGRVVFRFKSNRNRELPQSWAKWRSCPSIGGKAAISRSRLRSRHSGRTLPDRQVRLRPNPGVPARAGLVGTRSAHRTRI